jgi:iron complex outermembrane receptor protein
VTVPLAATWSRWGSHIDAHQSLVPRHFEVIMFGRSSIALLLITLVIGSRVEAQQRDSGTVIVTVQEPMGPVDGALLRSEGRTATTDAEGRARIVLPAGRRTLTLARIGYRPKRVQVVVPSGGEIKLTIELTMEEMPMAEMADITVTATRTGRLAGETPIRVEVLDEMEVEENTLMSPSGISMLLNETPGIRVQNASPSLGTGSVRILGLPGQYTAMLADGLPLYGGASSSLGPLDISPVDLQRVEIIKGAASALYGGQSLGGVINLVSKPPSGRKEVLLNRRTLGVTDGATWLSHRFTPTTGITFEYFEATSTASLRALMVFLSPLKSTFSAALWMPGCPDRRSLLKRS